MCNQALFETATLDPAPVFTLFINVSFACFTEDTINLKDIMNGEVSLFDPKMLGYVFQMLATETLSNKNVQEFLADKSQHFDMVIAEWMLNELYSG